MKSLRESLLEYLTIRRSLGFKLKRSEYELRRFIAFAEKRRRSFITIELALLWANRSQVAKPVTRAKQLRIVRMFAQYMSVEDSRTQVPGLDLIPNPEQRRSIPYVYTGLEIRKLISATDRIEDPFRRYTYNTLFSLLSVTGMRIGEVLSLERSDFNECEGFFVVRDSKFGKSREVMLHKSTVKALKKYAEKRDRNFKNLKTNAFFISRVKKPLIYENVNFTFIKMLGFAGLKTQKPNRPRLHDLRHTFAIRALIDCYKRGENSEQRLYELSTYMGHSSPANTYWYLTAVPELLAEGVKCLEKVKRRT